MSGPLLRLLPLVSAAALAVGVSAAPAQDVVSIRILDDGRPAGGIEVQVLFLGEAWRVGETDGDGAVRAPLDLVGLNRGDTVQAHAMACAGATTVLLAPPGEDVAAECERRAGAAMGCSCGSLGEFRWGDDTTIEIRPRPRTALEDLPPPDRREDERRPAREPGLRPTWVFGAGGGIASFPQLDVGCRPDPAPPVATCDITAERPTVRAALEYRANPYVPFGFLVEAGWTGGLEVEHVFGATADPRDPAGSRIEMDVLDAGGYALGRWARSASLDAWAALGYAWVFNTATVTTTFQPTGRVATEEREDSGGRIAARAGLDWWPGGGGWGLRLQAGGMAGKDDDADTHWHGAFQIVVRGGW